MSEKFKFTEEEQEKIARSQAVGNLTPTPNVLDSVRLLAAARTLCERLRTIANDPKYIAVWQIYAVHDFKYDGPFYVDELEALEVEIKKSENHD